MVYTRLYDWTDDRDGGIKIRADRMDAEFDGIFTALNGLIDGTATWTGAIKGYGGTVSLPGYSFDGDLNSGIYRVAADQVGIALAGVQHADFATTGTQLLLKGAPTAGGTADALTVTWGIVPSALASGQRILFKAASANTGAATLNLNGLGAKAIRKISGGTDAALAAGDIAAANFYEAVYDSTANTAAGAWILITPNAASSDPQLTTIELGHASDTTLSRSAAGKLAVEGVDVALLSGAQTLTDKTLTTPTITLKQGAAPAPTAEGDIQWDTDDNVLVIGDGAASKTFLPIPASTAAGDIEYFTGAKVKARLAIGTAAQVLTVNAGATAPEWAAAASSGQPVPTSSSFAIGTLLLALNSSGGNVLNGNTTAGTNIEAPLTTGSQVLVTTGGAAQTGTWKNITGATVTTDNYGCWVRTA